jgi:hypothetical protein
MVMPKLHNRLSDIAAGTRSLDDETRAFIRHELGFRVMPLSSPQEAFLVEKLLCTGRTEAGQPLLNPH